MIIKTANFDNAFSIIMNNFPESIGLQTNSSLQDGNKSKICNWDRNVLNLQKVRNNRKKVDFSNNVTYTFQ